MYSKRKLVFYCDFCRKYKLTSFSMKAHERHCTLNPDRECRTVACNGDCPICQFAKARQSGWVTGGWETRDLEAEMQEWANREYQDWVAAGAVAGL